MGMWTPKSTIGTVQNMEAYRQHVIEANTNGKEPMSLSDFIDSLEAKKPQKQPQVTDTESTQSK